MSAYDTPSETCPYCGACCEAEWADVGVGMVQCGPYHCMSCKASEIGPYDKPRTLTAQETATGWYAPESEPGSSANVIDGEIVSVARMQQAYHAQFTGNPDYHREGVVAQWFEQVRQPNKKEK